MDNDLEKYRHLKEYMTMAEKELQKMLRMIDTILEDVESLHNIKLNPELCLNVRDQAVRIRSHLASRLTAIEDLINILREYGMEI